MGGGEITQTDVIRINITLYMPILKGKKKQKSQGTKPERGPMTTAAPRLTE